MKIVNYFVEGLLRLSFSSSNIKERRKLYINRNHMCEYSIGMNTFACEKKTLLNPSELLAVIWAQVFPTFFI